jgi:AAA domain
VNVSEQAVERWAGELQADDVALRALWKVKRWTPETIKRLGVGFDGTRVTIPERDAGGRLVGLLRYAPAPFRSNGEPKTLAEPGSKRDLFPAPELIEGPEVWIVEGEPDAVAATALGLPAVGVPGTGGWRKVWARRFEGRDVVVLMDCDAAGRLAAKKIAEDLLSWAASVRVIALDPDRDDGYDLGDFLAAKVATPAELPAALRRLREMERQTAIYEPAPDLRHAGDSNRDDGPVVTWASDVKRERVDWLWSGRVPRATLTVVLGVPGLGKSMLTCKLAAEASQRGERVLMLTAEDSQAHTVEPRLAAWEARKDRIGFLSMRRSGFLEDLALPDDIDALRDMARRHRPTLIVIDPLAAHFGTGVDVFRDPSVRRALAPLRRLAEEIGVAIIVVIHLNKGTGTDPIMRAGGSIGQMGAARSALLVANDPDDSDGEDGMDRVVAHVKCNIAPKAPSLKFIIEPVLLDDGDHAARIVQVGESDYSGRDLLAAALDGGSAAGGSKRERAKTYLVMRLGDGPKEAGPLIQGAALLGISERTLRAAKQELGIERDRVSLEGEGRGEGFWTWRLPDPGEETGGEEDEQ